MIFELHTQLQQDCFDLGSFPLCRLLLMNDSRYPWLILVPQSADVEEIYQLSDHDRAQLCKESNYLAARMAEFFKADKINIAALGNIVPQLHVHHVARRHKDAAWPAPIWGLGEAIPYQAKELERITQKVQQILKNFQEG